MLIDLLPDGIADEPIIGFTFWRRAHLFPNGDLLGLYTNIGVVKIDDLVAIFLSPDGEAEREISLAEAFYESLYVPLLWNSKDTFDLLHANTVKWPEGRLAHRIPAFKKGNVLTLNSDGPVLS